MALADLMKKGFLTSATATLATPATLKPKYKPAVAGVAVANDRNHKHSASTVASVAAVAVANFQNSKSEILTFPMTDMVREFMEVDGMILTEAQAMAAVSVQPRPATEWMAMITELDALIETFCMATGMAEKAKAEISATRCGQSLASIPETLTWFRREVARMTKPTPAPLQQQNFETKASANSARGNLYQMGKVNL